MSIGSPEKVTTMQATPSRIVGVDTGGTFTDVTVMDTETGRLWTAKTSSTPDDPSRGFDDGIAKAMEVAGLASPDVARVLHATTVATNLILEQKGARVGMLVTDGFKYVLEIARQDVPRGSNLLAWVKPRRPVPPQDIWEIGGRMDHEGKVVTPLDAEGVRGAARAMRARGIDAIAIVFLHSYANAAHEREAAGIVRQEHPDALVSVSSNVMPVFREYERSMTTNLNAYVMASVSTYVGKLEARLKERRIGAPLLLMKSSGGVTSARNVRRAPVETALSGPAAGVVGARFIGESVGARNLIGIDIGGTSADISLIHQGEIGLTVGGRVGDWPVGLPMVDLSTIGAGGGSIARISASRGLAVGPHSAGAMPGPVCYGRGGSEPTVTDAHLVLGHLPEYLLNGSLKLDRAAARRAIEERVARPLGLSVENAASGILDIANNNMAGAIRVLSVERGYDPRDFVLVPFGGAGPLHGGALARIMGIRTILLAPAPGVLSALGLLVSNLKAEFSRTCVQAQGRHDLAQLARIYGQLEQDARAWLDKEEVPDSMRRITRVASLRYEHQGFELAVPWAGDDVEEEALAATVKAFHDTHRRMYTFAQEDTPVEIVTLRVEAAGMFRAPVLSEATAVGPAADAVTGTVPLWVGTEYVQAPVYDRARLGVGEVVEGPAVLTQLDCTTLLLSGQKAQVHRLASLIVTDESIP
jgi:N-methylhydantoinase A